jgi:hypothetical protein
MKRFLFVQLILVLATVACSTSVEVKDFKPAQGPHGVQIELKLNGDVIDGDKVKGELLAVHDDGVLLSVVDYPDSASAGSTVVLIPFGIMDTAKVEQMGTAKVESRGEEANETYRARLRLVARFPQGLSDELLSDLLQKMGQQEVEVLHATE